MKLPLFVLALLSVHSLSALASPLSQTFIHYPNGKIQILPPSTNDYKTQPTAATQLEEKNAAFLYETATTASVISMGGNYALLPNGEMLTIDEFGNPSVKTKAFYKNGFQASVLGGSFYLEKDTNQIMFIDSAGFYVATGVKENNLRLAGGNFYIDKSGVAVTMQAIAQVKQPDGTFANNPGGAIFPTHKIGMGDFSKVTKVGGNFIVNSTDGKTPDGTIHTISNDGSLYGPYIIGTKPKIIGGNYFIGEDKILYTVSSTGIWKKNSPILGVIKTYGYSYLVADDGYFIFVDGNGDPHTRLVHFLNDGGAEFVEKFSGFDTPKSFIPANQ